MINVVSGKIENDEHTHATNTLLSLTDPLTRSKVRKLNDIVTNNSGGFSAVSSKKWVPFIDESTEFTVKGTIPLKTTSYIKRNYSCWVLTRYRWKNKKHNANLLATNLLDCTLVQLNSRLSPQRWEGCEERVEADTDREQLLLNSLFGNETFLCSDPACEHSPFTLCIAHLQLRWYGLRSMSMSHIDTLPSKTHRNIMSATPVAILSL